MEVLLLATEEELLNTTGEGRKVVRWAEEAVGVADTGWLENDITVRFEGSKFPDNAVTFAVKVLCSGCWIDRGPGAACLSGGEETGEELALGCFVAEDGLARAGT